MTFEERKRKSNKTFSIGWRKSKWGSKNLAVYPNFCLHVFCLIGWEAFKLGPSNSYAPFIQGNLAWDWELFKVWDLWSVVLRFVALGDGMDEILRLFLWIMKGVYWFSHHWKVWEREWWEFGTFNLVQSIEIDLWWSWLEYVNSTLI